MPKLLSLLALALAACSGQVLAQAPLSSGQTIYLPVYSHVYHGDLSKDGKPMQSLVSTHVSIRNTDPQTAIRVLGARYYDTQGKLVRTYLTTPVAIGPMGTHEFFVPRSDTAGGSGANFVIVWASDAPANPPLIEALHADIREARSLMFVTTGVPIQPR